MAWTFNGTTDVGMGLTTTDIRRSLMPEVKRSTLEVPGMPGAYLMQTNIGERRIEIDVVFVGTTLADAIADARTLATWLYTNVPLELTFDDDPNVVYYAQLDGDTELEAIAKIRRGTIVFMCSDPFAYDTVVDEYAVTQGSNTLTNNGGVDTYPKFDLVMAGDTTFLDIAAESGFVRVGLPDQVDGATPTVNYREDFYEDFSGTPAVPPAQHAPWELMSGICEGGSDSTGSPMMGHEDGYVFIDDPGTGDSFHGPTIVRHLATPAHDFQTGLIFYWTDSAAAAMGRIQLYALNSAHAVIGKAGIQDSWGGIAQTAFHAQAGGQAGTYASIVNILPAQPQAWNTCNWGAITLQRRTLGDGTVWTAIMEIVDPALGAPFTHWRLERTYKDLTGACGTDDLHAVAIHMSVAGSTEPTKQWASECWAWEWTDGGGGGATDSSVIAQANDRITVDMRTGAVLLNGSTKSKVNDTNGVLLPMSALVHYTSSFFPIAVGSNTVDIAAGCNVSGTAYVHERWL